MIVPLAVGEPNPVQRLVQVTRATTERKRRPERLASLRPVGSLTILRALNRYSRHQHIVDLFVTNVPGPPLPCTCWALACWRRSRWCRWPATSR
jgi:WS/DGAT C-terminal domain